MDIVEKINGILNEGKELSIFDRHKLVIAKKTLNMSDVGARIMDGMTKEEAREIIKKLTGKEPIEDIEEDAVNFSDKTKWEEIAKSKGAKKFNKDSKTGEVIAVDDKDNFLGAWNERTRKGMM